MEMTEAGSPARTDLVLDRGDYAATPKPQAGCIWFRSTYVLLSVLEFAMASAPHTLRQVARPHAHTAAHFRHSSSHLPQQPPAPKVQVADPEINITSADGQTTSIGQLCYYAHVRPSQTADQGQNARTRQAGSNHTGLLCQARSHRSWVAGQAG